MPERPVELSNSKADFDRFSATHSPRLTVARVDNSSEDEEEGMDLKQRSSLKGSTSQQEQGVKFERSPKDLSSYQFSPSSPSAFY